jgi:hypothetical protein
MTCYPLQGVEVLNMTTSMVKLMDKKAGEQDEKESGKKKRKKR